MQRSYSSAYGNMLSGVDTSIGSVSSSAMGLQVPPRQSRDLCH
jgi:hypothetical protein